MSLFLYLALLNCFQSLLVIFHGDRDFKPGPLFKQWIRFPPGSISESHSNVRKSVRCVTLFDSPAYGVEWVFVSALRVNGSTKCHICQTFLLEINISGWLGVTSVCSVCEEKGGVVPGWALSEMGPRGPELKPYLRGFRTDGVPLFQGVFIIRKWGE